MKSSTVVLKKILKYFTSVSALNCDFWVLGNLDLVLGVETQACKWY